MTDYAQIERRLTDVLQLSRRPVAIAFRDTPPEGVRQLSGSQPSGCSFWRLAAEGQAFYTVPSDHYNCPVGSYTHNIALPPEREAELNGTLGLMVDIGYIKMEEVPGVPRLPQTPSFIVYAPLSQTPVAPDAILVAGQPAKLMQEAMFVVQLIGLPVQMRLDRFPQLVEVIPMNSLQPVVELPDAASWRQTYEHSPPCREMDLLTSNLPFPEAIVGAHLHQREALLASLQRLFCARPIGDVVPQHHVGEL